MSRLITILLWLWGLGALAQAPSEVSRLQAPQVPVALPESISGEISTRHFRIVHTEAAKGAATALSETLESLRGEFEKSFGRPWPGQTEVRIGVGREEMDSLALPGGKPPSWAAALAYPAHGIILVEARSLTAANGAAIVAHELCHVALGQLSDAWPRWFQEGFASHLADHRRLWISQYATMFRAVHQDRIFSFEDLSSSWPSHPDEVELAYLQSESFVAFLLERHGRDRLGELFDHMKRSEPFEIAFAKAFHTSLALEEKSWKNTLPARYSWLPVVTGGTTLWALAAALTVFGYFRVRAARERKRALQAIEEAELAAEEEALRLLEAEVRAEAEGVAAAPEDASSEKPTLH